MTSKISLRKLIASDMKRRSWLIILISLAGFFIYPVMYCMSLIQARETYSSQVANNIFDIVPLEERYLDLAKNFFGGEGTLLTILALTAAVLTACTGFSWLHSREQTDFYAGMPVKRVHLFLTPYVSGILIAVIPYLVFVLTALLGVGAVFGNVTPEVIKASVPGIIWGIVAYLTVYTTAVLAMLLTGRTVLGMAVMAFFFFYGPMVYWMLTMLAGASFDTYYGAEFEGVASRFSPLFLVSEVTTSRLSGLLLITYLVAALVFCLLVMEKRPMERAEMPFAHPFIAPCLKVLTGVPVAMFMGEFVSEIIVQAGDSKGWGIFWCFAVALVFNVAFEMILSTDVKNLLGHWKSAGALFAGVLVLVCIFPLDLMGYDRFLPKEEEIESMAIGQESVYECFANDAYVNGYTPDGESLDLFLMGETLTEKFGPIYSIAREGVLGGADESSLTVPVRYHLKSGRDVYRMYTVSEKTVTAALTQLFEDKALREAAYPFRYLKEDYLGDLQLSSWKMTAADETPMQLDEAERAELARCLRADSLEVNAGLVSQREPAGLISVQTPYDAPGEEMNIAYCMSTFLIYPEYTRTLAFFRDRGWVPAENENTEIVKSIHLWRDVDELFLTDAGDIEAFFTCVTRVREAHMGRGEAYVYYEIDTADGYLTAGAGTITDPEVFGPLIEKAQARAAGQ